MSSILRTAASALQAQQYNLDTIANNLANVSTAGYKKTRVSFADAAKTSGTTNGVVAGPEAGSGVSLAATQKIFAPGALSETGNLWDLAIVGDGFFQILTPDGRMAYTRDGSFGVDEQGHPVTSQGMLIEPEVTIPTNARNIAVDPDGAIYGEVEGQQVQLGRISIATFPNPEGLISVGHNLFVASEASGDAQVGSGGTDRRGMIQSGVLESSNVDMTEEMTRTIEAQRAYQMNIKVLQTADEMLGLANNLRR